MAGSLVQPAQAPLRARLHLTPRIRRPTPRRTPTHQPISCPGNRGNLTPPDEPTSVNPRPIGGRYASAMQVLVVEDDQPLVRILTKSLESNGFDVASAFDGETGLRTARDGRFDAIVLD